MAIFLVVDNVSLRSCPLLFCFHTKKFGSMRGSHTKSCCEFAIASIAGASIGVAPVNWCTRMSISWRQLHGDRILLTKMPQAMCQFPREKPGNARNPSGPSSCPMLSGDMTSSWCHDSLGKRFPWNRTRKSTIHFHDLLEPRWITSCGPCRP